MLPCTISSAIVAVTCMFSWAAKHELWHFTFRCTAVAMIERIIKQQCLEVSPVFRITEHETAKITPIRLKAA